MKYVREQIGFVIHSIFQQWLSTNQWFWNWQNNIANIIMQSEIRVSLYWTIELWRKLRERKKKTHRQCERHSTKNYISVAPLFVELWANIYRWLHLNWALFIEQRNKQIAMIFLLLASFKIAFIRWFRDETWKSC